MRLPVIFLGEVLLILFCLLKTSLQPRCSVLHYSTEDGLPDNRVMCITKDHEGFMWFGTWAGITRFDGHNFVTFRSQETRLRNQPYACCIAFGPVRCTKPDRGAAIRRRLLHHETFSYRIFKGLYQ